MKSRKKNGGKHVRKKSNTKNIGVKIEVFRLKW
jgi:hypothetical protein